MTDKCQDELAQFDRHISEVKQSIEKKLDLIEKLKREGREKNCWTLSYRCYERCWIIGWRY